MSQTLCVVFSGAWIEVSILRREAVLLFVVPFPVGDGLGLHVYPSSGMFFIFSAYTRICYFKVLVFDEFSLKTIIIRLQYLLV